MRWRLAFCCASVVLLVALRFWSSAARAEERHGRYTANQIMDRAEYVCGQLAPSDGSVRIAADAVTVPRPRGKSRLFWHVDCTDTAGRLVSFLRWDAETGAILSLSHLCDAPRGNRLRPADARDAVAASRRVLEALRPFTDAGPWKLYGREVPAAYTSLVLWRSGRREAIITLDAAAQLRTVEFLSLSPTSIRGAENQKGTAHARGI